MRRLEVRAGEIDRRGTARGVLIGRPGQWPLFGDRPGLRQKGRRSKCARSQPHERRHRLGPRQGQPPRQPPKSTRARPGSQAPARRDDRARGTCRHPRGARGASNGILGNAGVGVDEAEHAPGADRNSHVRRGAGSASAGTSRTPTSSARAPTIAPVPSSLPSSATMTSKAVSGSQRWSRETPEARATPREWRSRPRQSAPPVSRRDYEGETNLTHHACRP